MKNEKTILNDKLFTTKYLPSKNIYPPKDFPTPFICNIHCLPQPLAPAIELDYHETIPLGSGDKHQDEYSSQTSFQGYQ